MSLRQMTPGDIAAGLRLCRAAGWNQLEDDWQCFLELNPEGCRVVESAEGVAGTVTTLRYEDRFAWISMVLVDPGMRHQGIGTMLLREALRLLEDVPTVRLDATSAGKRVYDRLGFVDEYRLSRMRARNPQIMHADGVQSVTDSDMPDILALDCEVFGADRGAILDYLRRNAPKYAKVAKSPKGIGGFVFGRHGFHAEHLGPMIALDEATARRLVSACLAEQAAGAWIIDVPQHNEDWSRWLQSAGFVEERQLIRMFKGNNTHPGLPRRQFAIAGPEFG